MLNVSEQCVEINKRFFMAIEHLVKEKKLRGLKTFARLYGINQGNLTTAKTKITEREVKTEYLSYLVRDFGISAEWLLLGTGNIKK